MIRESVSLAPSTFRAWSSHNNSSYNVERIHTSSSNLYT